jgi:aminoglycoside phosphotransferase family enzyme
MSAASGPQHTDAAPLAEKVAFLREPTSYPTGTSAVEAIETHMAWVFLTDRHAYKLKKPVAYAELDFTTLARRHWACAEEVRLNRRLAGDVYQGLVPLTADPQDTLALGGDGEIVDWLVQMHRLPADRMLDTLIAQGDWPADGVRAAVRKLAAFYAEAPLVPFTPAEYLQRLHRGLDQTARALAASSYAIPLKRVREVYARLDGFLRGRSDLLADRVRAHRVAEGHGDLRPEHLCLLQEEPVIFDCIEFDRSLRLLDVADELSFLSMECERLGAPDVGTTALDAYADATGDALPDRLVHFYQSYRALQRAQIAVRHTRRPGTPDEAKWSEQAAAYLYLAVHHTDSL